MYIRKRRDTAQIASEIWSKEKISQEHIVNRPFKEFFMWNVLLVERDLGLDWNIIEY